MTTYATYDDVVALKGTQSDSRKTIIENSLGTASAMIRQRAKLIGKDFDAMIEEDDDLAAIAKVVVVDAVTRYCDESEISGAPMSQMSESAGGYSVSGTYLNPGRSLYIMENEFKRLGLKRQKIGVISLYGN